MTQRMLFALSLGFGGLILATQAAQSAPQCGPRATVMAALAETCGENAVSAPNGRTCLVASGRQYQARSDAPSRKGDPA